MSSAPAAAAANRMPMFHHNLVPLDPVRHADLRLDRGTGYGYSAGAEAIPIGIGEFAEAAHSYPILITDEANPVPVVLLGFRQGWNLFVNHEGEWMTGAYVPAIVRAYPFAIIEEAGGKVRTIGIEAGAGCLGTARGEPLFVDGKASATLDEAIALCDACQANLNEAAALAAALDEAGVLVPREGTITANRGGSVRIAGFKTADPERLRTVPEELFLEWRRRDWLPAIYAHLFSAANWTTFTDLVLAHMPARQ
jgi:hypothetical protein